MDARRMGESILLQDKEMREKATQTDSMVYSPVSLIVGKLKDKKNSTLKFRKYTICRGNVLHLLKIQSYANLHLWNLHKCLISVDLN